MKTVMSECEDDHMMNEDHEGLNDEDINVDNLVYDPRPVEFRNRPGQKDRLRNFIINFCFTHGTSMAFMQMIPPANPYAIAVDHDYSRVSPEDQYLLDHMVSLITAKQAKELEKSTHGQRGNKKWRNVSLRHITSCNFGKICKAKDKDDLDKLAKSFTTESWPRTKPFLHHLKYKAAALECFEHKWNAKTEPCGIFVCVPHPQLAASPERVLHQDCIVVVKCPYVAQDRSITPTTVPFLKLQGDSLVLDEKHDYYYEVQGHLLCSNRKVCMLVVYTFKDTVVVTVPRDDPFIQEMVEKLLDFYRHHFRSALLNKFFYREYDRYHFDYS